MAAIDKTAIVSPKAELGENVTVGPFVVIEDDVQIGDNTDIGPHSVIYNGARIGKNVKIYQGASISNDGQDLKYKGEEAHFYVGDNTIIREFVTLNKGTTDRRYSKVGENCLLMAYSHVAHDCVIGDNCILANLVQVGGHSTIEDWVIVGGDTSVHQFSKIGKHAMVAGGYRIIADIPPFVLAGGEPLRFAGVNIVGLRRRGFSNDEITTIKSAYMDLYKSGRNLSDAKKFIAEKYAGNTHVEYILEFLEKISRHGFK